MNPKLKLYVNPEYRHKDNLEEAFAIFFPEHTTFLIRDYKFIRVFTEESILDESNIDQFMNTRNFIKLLEFDKENILWNRHYYLGNDELKSRLSLMKSDCKELRLYKIFVYINLLRQKL